MILTHKEYFKKFPDKIYYDYTKPSLGKEYKTLKAGFLLWTDDPSRWAGDYEGGYVAFHCRQYKTSLLPSIKTIRENQRNYINSQTNLWPEGTLESISIQKTFSLIETEHMRSKPSLEKLSTPINVFRNKGLISY